MKYLVTLFFTLLFVSISLNISFSQSASIKTSSGTSVNLYFTGDSTDPKTWYQDAIDGNPDVGIEICDVGPKYVGAAYAINVNGEWKYSLISYRSSTEALAYTDQDEGNGCYFTSPGYLTISPSHLTTPSPNVYYASFPGKIRVAYASTSNPGTLSNFILTQNTLRGSYSVTRSFDEGTLLVTVQTPTIQFQSQAGSFSKPADDPTFGINSDRQMVIGLCSDENGDSCYDGYVLSSPSFPLQLQSGVPVANDQNTYTRYVVINSLGHKICIGANLQAKIDSIQPNPVYYSQTLTIKYTITNYRDTPTEQNGGNVRVTTDFRVEVKIYRQDDPSQIVFDNFYTITDDLLPGDSLQKTVTWNATAKSGNYIVEVSVDPDNTIKECVETDNTATDRFELKPVILPEIWINGVKTNTFEQAGVPYNLTLHLKNSDDVNISNGTVYLIEENGINVFSPTQIWNRQTNLDNTSTEKTITKVYNKVEFLTDWFGNAQLTIIPTGNLLYAPEYNSIGFKDIAGNYSIYLQGYDYSGEPFVFVINGNITDKYPLHVTNYYYYEDVSNSYSLPNINSYVEAIMNTVYTIFSKFWKVMVG